MLEQLEQGEGVEIADAVVMRQARTARSCPKLLATDLPFSIAQIEQLIRRGGN